MPVVNYATYKKMLDAAYSNKYAFPAINVANIEMANAVLEGLAEAKSDGIIQVSIGGGEHTSGSMIKDPALGAITIANHVHAVADRYNVCVALHTDHCLKGKAEKFILPVLAETEKRRANGLPNLFNSHMFDGSDLSLTENLIFARELMIMCERNEVILEVEAGVVGGEEDGVSNEHVGKEKLYTTPEDMLQVYDTFKEFKNTTYMLAATFGNVHGVYKPGNVQLNPKILRDGQNALKAKYGADCKFYLVFHGGSGSTQAEIAETLDYGVVKMNVDTDTQYSFTRPIVDHMFTNYSGVIKVEGEVGNKKVYDPRSYLKAGTKGMAARVVEACKDLHSTGKTIF